MSRRSPDPVGADTRLVLDALRRIVRTLRTPERRPGDLSAARLFVMQTLAGAGTLSVNEIAARTHTHQSSVSVVVKELARSRLVRRTRSPGDARRVDVSLTRRGVARLRSAPRAPQERIVAGIEALAPAARARLAASLAELVGAMGVGGEVPAMFFEEPPRTRAGRRSRSARA